MRPDASTENCRAIGGQLSTQGRQIVRKHRKRPLEKREPVWNDIGFKQRDGIGVVSQAADDRVRLFHEWIIAPISVWRHVLQGVGFGKSLFEFDHSRQIFDGATVENSVLVSAVIGAKVEPDADAAKKSPLLNRPGWRVRLAFFPADQKAEKPDYELGMLLLDNGVSRDMVIDYGEYSIRAKLDDIEALPKPGC